MKYKLYDSENDKVQEKQGQNYLNFQKLQFRPTFSQSTNQIVFPFDAGPHKNVMGVSLLAVTTGYQVVKKSFRNGYQRS